MNEGFAAVGIRREHDSLGEVNVPGTAYYGAQTARAIANFPISGIPISHHKPLLKSLAMVKQAAARANAALGKLDPAKRDAIIAAAQEVIDGKLDDHFPVDVFQGGAGTSTNMNMNEVLSHRGLELMGLTRGDVHALHANDHVNMSQSTNDAYPTAVRVAVLLSIGSLSTALDRLATAFERKAAGTATIVKLGRTQLQDAVPMTVGQELGAYAVTVREDIQRLAEASRLLCEINLGGTAIGTGINADPAYGPLAITELAKISGFPLVQSENLVEASWDMGGFVMFSAVLKRIATKLSKIASDIRLLSSGPRGGIGEYAIPAMQPGSSIMPGKVNPVIPEAMNLVCFQVIGNDLAVTLAAEGGQLQLNAFEPLIAHNILSSIQLLTNTVGTFTERCIDGLEPRVEECLRHIENSVSTVTALVPILGYERAAELAKRALADGRTVRDLARETGALTEAQLDEVLNPGRLAAV
ncbi:MAG TPA: aspartate ammonia-lyase [Acetobacteraceae bacterium]|jgi:aspartate ammonia-lyase|nr:aspartate ammonia-lyase [Acetobacteraceae bacterium]